MASTGIKNKGLLIAAGAVALWFVVRGAQFINGVNFTFKKIRFGGSFFLPEAYATFKISNASNETVSIDNIAGNILFQSTPVADVNTINAVQLLPYQDIDIELKLNSKITDLLTVLGNALKGNLKNNILFSGTVMTNGISVPVNTTLL